MAASIYKSTSGFSGYDVGGWQYFLTEKEEKTDTVTKEGQTYGMKKAQIENKRLDSGFGFVNGTIYEDKKQFCMNIKGNPTVLANNNLNHSLPRFPNLEN